MSSHHIRNESPGSEAENNSPRSEEQASQDSSPTPIIPGGNPRLFTESRVQAGQRTHSQSSRPSLTIGQKQYPLYPFDPASSRKKAAEETEMTEEYDWENYLDDDDDDDGDDDDSESYGDTHASVNPRDLYPQITTPIKAGVDIERSGNYGRPPHHYSASQSRIRGCCSKNMFDILSSAEGSYRLFDQRLLSTNLPNTHGTEVAAYGSRIYSGQYSDDGTFFYTCAQAFRVYIYDMTAWPVATSKATRDTTETWMNTPFYAQSDLHYSSLKTVRTFQAPAYNCQWTITDANLSPDNNWMVYSSITPYVHLVKTRGEDAVLGLGLEEHEQEVLDLSGGTRRQTRGMGIWSIRFDSEGKELIAGCSNGQIVAYDIERKTCLLHVRGHEDDTNAVAYSLKLYPNTAQSLTPFGYLQVCFADKSDGNILVSGSDDSYLKVWDRRSLRDAKPAGALIGHTEGITFVSSKGDGRYIVSNGKDQAAKLWDLRTMISGETFDSMERIDTSIGDWDYRHGTYAPPRFPQHPHDCSVMTYRGHAVLNTLIRVHFSPPNTTGHRYISSASSDGKIHIWNLDGTVAQIIDRSKTSPLMKPKSFKSTNQGDFLSFNDPHEVTPAAYARPFRGYYEPTVRDISWNPNEPTIMSTSWGGSHNANGSLAMHTFKPIGRRASS